MMVPALLLFGCFFLLMFAGVPIAASLGVSVAQVALAWMLTRPFVTSIIIGAKTKDQLLDNLAAGELKLSAEQVARLDEASALPKEYPGWMVERQDRDRRPVAEAKPEPPVRKAAVFTPLPSAFRSGWVWQSLQWAVALTMYEPTPKASRAPPRGGRAASGEMSRPSIGSSGSFASINLATVGRISMVEANSSQRVPAGIFPGQRIKVGTRTPPSKLVPFPSRKGPAFPAWLP